MSSADSIPLIPGWLRIVHVENTGAAFGMLAEAGSFLHFAVLVAISALVTCLVIAALASRQQAFTGTITRISLAFILGGAVGNLFDRVFRGAVTDFIEVYHGGWAFPSFNVADSAITVGAILLAAESLWPKRQVGEPQTDLAQK